MDEQTDGRRPFSTKVAGIRALMQSAAGPEQTEEWSQRKADTEEAERELVAALAAAGFQVSPPGGRGPSDAVGVSCTTEEALALASWLRTQQPRA